MLKSYFNARAEFYGVTLGTKYATPQFSAVDRIVPCRFQQGKDFIEGEFTGDSTDMTFLFPGKVNGVKITVSPDDRLKLYNPDNSLIGEYQLYEVNAGRPIGSKHPLCYRARGKALATPS